MARRPLGTPGPSVSTLEGQNYTKFRIRWLPFSRAMDQGGAGLLLELVVHGAPWTCEPRPALGQAAGHRPGTAIPAQTR